MAGYGSLGVQGLTYQLLDVMYPLIDQARTLVQKYDVVVTNPPYMGSSGMNAKLSDYVKKYYPDSKSDLFAVFIEHGNEMVKRAGFNCMVTMQSWMFLSSFEKMRVNALQTKTITNLMHMENMVMGIAFGTAVTVFQNVAVHGYKGTYNQIKLQDIENDVPKQFPVSGNRFAQVSTDNFSKIPGSPVAYWVSKNFIDAFASAATIGEKAVARSGLSTGDNERFMRLWYEPSVNSIAFGLTSNEQYIATGRKFVPCNKGGLYRRWYGNNDYVIDWTNPDAMHRPRTTYMNLYYRPAITWSAITSALFNARVYGVGFLFDHAAASLFIHNKEDEYFALGYLNTNVGQYILSMINPTINTGADVVSRMPFKIKYRNAVIPKVEQNVLLSKSDWDSFETSWDFKRHPLV